MSSDTPCPLPDVMNLAEARLVIASLQARQQELERKNAELLTAHRQAVQDSATATNLLELTGELAQVGGWQVDLSTMKLIWTRETFRISDIDPPVEPDLENGINLFALAARPVIAAAVQAAIDHGTPYDLELPIITVKGRHKWVRTQGYAVRENGRSIRLIGTFQDITQVRATEARLHDLQAIHSSVFDSLTKQIAVLDERGIILTVNRAWREFAARNGDAGGAGSPEGQNYLTVCQQAVMATADEYAHHALAGIQAVLTGEKPLFEMEYPCHSPDQQRWFHLRVIPMVAGRRGLVVSHMDVTAHKQAEQSMRMALREIENRQFALDQHAILAVTDLRGRITQVNDLFCVISGYAREELLGQDHRLINSGFHPRGFFKNLWATITSGAVWHGEVCNRAKDGSLYWVSTTAVPLRDTEGGIQGYMAIRTDITQRKQTEDRLVEAKDRAERLNSELKARIKQANDLALKAERAAEVKSTFVANMSHEIRTPMNGIMGMIEVLLGTALSAEQEDYVRTAYRSAESLMAIINDILDFSKLEANRLVLEHIPFDLHELSFQVAELFRSQLAGRPMEMLVSVAPDVPRTLIGDPGRLRQILSNLVSNAVKFTSKGHVRIDVTWSEPQMLLAVSDTGIGIPANQIEHLFTPFTQLDASHSRKFGGSGLGLAISRRFAELMKGTLTVVSEEGRGSVFTLTVPLERGVESSNKPMGVVSRPVANGLAGLRVLMIDDNTVSSQIACGMLAEVGVRSEACRDGRQALDLLRHSHHDPFAAVIVDLRLQGMSGLDIARTIRADTTLASLPLLMLTGSGQPEELALIERAGFNGYLVKPVRSQVFNAVLAATISRCRSGISGMVTRYDVTESELSHRRVIAPLDADVLLVEDHEVNMKIATVALGKLGARVSLADNGRVAVEMVLKHRYDVVLMDCQMPVMDGYEATQAIRNHEHRTGSPRLPIIAMTANVMPGSRERCFAAGMDDFLGKPFKAQQLEDKLRQWVCPTEAAAKPGQVSAVVTGGAERATAAPAATDATPGALPIVDFAILREIERADSGMGHTIVTVFHGKLTQDVRAVGAQERARDYVALGQTAHKIRGSSGSIGAFALQAVAARLEAAALTADAERCAGLTRELERASQAVLARLSPAIVAEHLTITPATE